MRSAIRELAGPAILIALIVWMLHTSLFSGGRILPVGPDDDLHTQFLGWRYFGFTQWKAGHFPFWNPHVFCGIPFFAQMQSCLLYPLAWVNFIFNVGTGATIEITLDLCAAAIGTYLWARQRGISRCGATLAGAAFTFSGPVFLRISAGHLTILAAVAWMPLIFLACDRILARRFLSGILIGSASICLQWLGGHPQLVYYTMLIAGFYVLIQSIGCTRRAGIYFAFAGMYALGCLLPAVQVVPAILATHQSIRAGGLSYSFTSAFSFPPESLLTSFIPYPLGDSVHLGYVGRLYIWETSIYAGVVNLVLAAIAIAAIPKRQRWQIPAILFAILFLALGSITPLHRLLYLYLPGFGLFRGAAKFAPLWTLWISLLAGQGFDLLQQRRFQPSVVMASIAAVLCILLGIIFLAFTSSTGPAARLLSLVFNSNQYMNDAAFRQANLLPRLAIWIGWQWIIAGGLLAALAILIFVRQVWATHGVLFLAIAEIFFAAWIASTYSPVQMPYPRAWMPALQQAATADQRVLYANSLVYGNTPNLFGPDSVWGYDPAQPARYTDLISASQNDHPAARESYYPSFSNISRIFQLLRCAYLLRLDKDSPTLPLPDAMPHLQLIGNDAIGHDSKTMAEQLARDFDFRHSVLLEQKPVPSPAPAGASGSVRLQHQSINDLEIDADLPAPALLLITDAYAPGWHATVIEPNPLQPTYEVLLADDVLRAIPLAAGHHHFDLSYSPPGLKSGIGLSILGLGLWIAGIIGLHFRKHIPPANLP